MAARRTLRRFRSGAVVVCAALLCALWAAVLFDAKKSDEAAIAQARRDAGNLTIAFREHIFRTVTAIDDLMIAIVANHKAHPSEYEIPDWIGSLPIVRDLAVQVGLIGPDGTLRASTLPITGPIDLSDRAHFKHHLTSSAGQPYISVPVVGRVSKKWSVQFTRRLSLDDGTFDGVVVISVDPSHIWRFFDDISLGPKGAAILVGRDGIVRARSARNDIGIGHDLSSTYLFQHLRSADTGTYVAISPFDGVERVIGYSAVSGYPLIVAIGLPTDDVLAAARRQKTVDFLLGGLGTLIIIVGTLLIARASRRRRQHEMALQAQQIYKAEKEKLDTALSNLSQGLLTFDANARLVLCNQRYLDLYRLSGDVVQPGCSLRELVEHAKAAGAFTEDCGQYCEDVLDGIRAGRASTQDFTLSDGRTIRSVRTALPAGGWIETHEDITEARKAEIAIRESEYMARGIIANSLDAIIQVNEAGEVIEWNPQAETIFGWTRGEAVGKPITELYLLPGYRPRYLAMNEQLSRTDAILSDRFEFTALRKDGSIIKAEVSMTGIRRGDGFLYNLFLRDITAKIAEEERRRQAGKMEAIGQLTGGIAHDFNNMLTVITGTIELLEDAVASDPQLVSVARMISSAADRGAELTRHLLAFSRQQPLRPRETDINQLVSDAARMFRPLLGEQIEIVPALDENPWPVLVDPTQLTSALLNLAVNARDAMPNGGTLMIETRNVHLDDSYAQANIDLTVGNYVMIAVSDTGAGIPEAIRDKIFEPFFSTKEVGKGTGLGLSMVYGFVKQSGGHIKLYSEVGHGTTIRIYLPQACSTSEAADTPISAAEIGGGQETIHETIHETILVVEDDALVRASVTAQLESLGYRTIPTANATEALEVIDKGTNFDLLLTDVIMAGPMNGRQLADVAATRRAGIKVLFTSGYTENSISHYGQLDPGVLLLTKPYSKSDLARMVRAALGSVVGDAAAQRRRA